MLRVTCYVFRDFVFCVFCIREAWAVQGLGWLGLLGLLYRRYHIGAPMYWFMPSGQRSRSDYPLHAFNIDDVFTMFRHVRVSETVSPLCVPDKCHLHASNLRSTLCDLLSRCRTFRPSRHHSERGRAPGGDCGGPKRRILNLPFLVR